MTRSGKPRASRLAVATKRLILTLPSDRDLYQPVMAFFDSEGERFCRAFFPKLKPSGKSGYFVGMTGMPGWRGNAVGRVYIYRDFRKWYSDDGASGDGVFSLLAHFLGHEFPRALLAAAAIEVIGKREPLP